MHVSLALKTFLTDTHDLFIIAETQNLTNEIYRVNIDDASPYQEGPVLTYSIRSSI